MSRVRRPHPGVRARAVVLVAIATIVVGCSASGTSATARPTAGSEAPASSAPADPSPTAGSASAAPPRATGAPSHAYAEFLARVNADRATVDGLDHDLSTAANAADLDAVRKAAVAILDFVDVERDWLLGHPPADCYADAHTSAMAMLEAYGGAGERFIDWSTTGGGLNGLPALGRAADAATTAQTALTTFAAVLGGTTCPT